MAFDSYSGPTEKYNGIPVKALRFFQLKEQQDVKMGDLKMVVDDIKTVITHFLNLNNDSGETIQLNGVDAGTSPSHVINFEDGGGATWTVTQDPATGIYTISAVVSGGGGTPAGSTTEIQYNNAGAFGADSGFTRTPATVTIEGDDTGTDGVLNIISGDADSQYIVLDEQTGRTGETYITFRGTTGDVAIFGVVYAAGSPDKYIFTDDAGTELVKIDIGTQEVTIRDLGGVGTRMVTADTNGKLIAAAVPTGTVTSVALSMPSAFSVAGSPITGAGTLAVTGAGTTAQYVRGDGSLATFPTVPTVTPAALTKTDDTNVTLTLGGTPATALLQAVSLTLGWTGTLADGRIASASTWNAKLTSALTSAHIFVGNGSNVATDVSMSGDATLSNTGAITIANDAVTYAKMQNVSATDKLLGRVTAGSGDVEEVTLDPDGTLAANSDDVVASQKAVKTYVDSKNEFAKSAATQTLAASTNLQAVTSMSLSIAANKNLWIDAVLWFDCSTTSGLGIGFAIPTGATMDLSTMSTRGAAVDAPNDLTTSAVVGTTTGRSNSVCGFIGTRNLVRVSGWVYNGANAGTIDLLASPSNVANTVKVVINSSMIGHILN